MPQDIPADSIPTAARPKLRELLFAFLRLGAVSFGGPAMVEYIKTMAVGRKGWLSESQYKSGVALCQAIPGATAMQCAAYVGWKTRGLPGAIASYVGFGFPAFVFMLALSAAYRATSGVPAVGHVLAGLRVVVVALIANSAWSFGRSTVKRRADAFLAAATAAAFFFGVNPLVTVAAAGAAGALLFRRGVGDVPHRSHGPTGWKAVFAPSIVALFGGAALAVAFVVDRKLGAVGAVMLRTDAMAFGGGFSAIPLMFHEVVDVRQWVSGPVFLDGLALGQVTPGPIVIASTFVGFQTAGYSGALVATVCMFLPSFLVLLLTEPWFDRLQESAWFRAAVRGALVSFVGLLVSATIQFASAVTWNWLSIAAALAAFIALARKVNVMWVVAAGVAVSAVVAAAGR